MPIRELILTMQETLQRVRRLPLTMNAMASFGAQIVAVLCGTALQITIARTLGVHEYGLFAFAYAILLTAVVPARLGLDHAFLRFIPTLWAERGAAGIWSLLRVLAAPAVSGICIAIIMTVIGSTFWPGLLTERGLLLAAATLVPLCLTQLLQAVLRALQKPLACQVPEALLRPVVILLGVAVLYLAQQWPLHAEEILALNLLATLCALGAAFLLLRSTLGSTPTPKNHLSPVTSPTTVVRFGFHLMIISCVQTLYFQTDVILLGVLGTPADAGAFAAALRVVSLLLMFNYAVASVAAPLIARHYDARDYTSFARILRQATIIIRVLTLTGIIATAIFPSFILRIFGDEFEEARLCLIILALAEVPRAWAAVSGTVLTVTGNPIKHHFPLLFALPLGVLLNIMLIPRFGAFGAALAYFSSSLVYNISVLMNARKVAAGLRESTSVV